jgi:hypothetical protein
MGGGKRRELDVAAWRVCGWGGVVGGIGWGGREWEELGEGAT